MSYGYFPGILGYLFVYRPTLLARGLPMLLRGQAVTFPFSTPHYTIHATAFGPGAAVRWGLFPCSGAQAQSPAAPAGAKEFVADITRQELAAHDVCMDLKVQRQRDPCGDSLENILVEWTSPWETVGTLVVPRGTSPTDNERCEDSSYNPLHVPKDFAPVGWVVSVRERLYADMAALRLKENRGLN